MDLAARLGGDEFGIVLADLAAGEDVAVVADRILEALKDPFVIQGHELTVHASIGIALSMAGQEKSDELLRNADVAMYIAKSRGKARYEIFHPKMHLMVLGRIEMKADLQRALEQDQFAMYYQPTIALDTGQVAGLEALVRWKHPRRGLLLPADFIPLAEETGLIVPIGRWVLQQACREAKLWQERYPGTPPLMMSVNLSSRQLQDPALAEDVVAALGESDLSPESLVLEITESVLMHDTDATAQRLRELKDVGVRLAIDDFGTGYSSLGYLRRLPLDIVKIDPSFVSGVGAGTADQALVQAILTLTRTLQLQAVAEGIELSEQFDQLRLLGCALGQGYYFTQPATGEDLHSLLEALAQRRS